VGSHGGVGGEQTDAFILHPPDLPVPETRNATDVFHILDGHRGAPVIEKPQAITETVADWAPATLAQGVRRTSAWLGQAVRCLFLDRTAYSAVADDPYMTGPALLLALVMLTLASAVRHDGFDLGLWLGDLGAWIVSVLALVVAGYLLTRHGYFTRTFRAVAFAQTVSILALLALIPGLDSAIGLLLLVVGFLATWMAAATAHGTRGWRTLLLPVVAYAVIVLAAVVFGILLAGAEFTIQGVLGSFGI
jgi:hypothetical protein